MLLSCLFSTKHGRLDMGRGSEGSGKGKALSYLKRRPLRVDILTAFTALLAVTVLVVIVYGYHRNSRAVLELSNEIISEVKELVIKEATLFLKPVATVSRLSARLAAHFDLKLPESEEFETYAIQILEEFPQVEMINMADEKGNFLMPKRMQDGSIATKLINRNETPATVTWKYRNILGNVIKTEKSTEVDYDPRERPWYQGAKKSGHTYWTDLYILFTDGEPGITASHPVIKGDGFFAGVFGFDMSLTRLSEFLKGLKIGKRGIAFIMNSRKEVVAHPNLTQASVKEGESLRPVRLEELDEEWTGPFLKAYEKRREDRFLFRSKGETFIGALVDFPSHFAGGWTLAIVVPEDDFMGPIKKTRTMTIIISTIILLIAVGCSVVLSYNISRPILRLVGETEKIKEFRLEDEMEIRSHIKEIQLLQGALRRMKASLKSFTRYAPEEIVREVVARGKEAMLGGEKREVSLLFCDLRGFTSFSERTRPEEVVSLLNEHFDVMVRLISQHRGFVIDFLGDSVFAAFGALREDPDHAARSVACAIEMQLARLELNNDNEARGLPPMEMGIGLNSGTCVAGNMGSTMRIKYGVVGHAVNLGARIESFTVGGQVLISESTYKTVKDLYVTRGPFEVWGKGVGEAIRLWEVRGAKGESSQDLPPTVPGLTKLAHPFAVRFKVMRGKQIGKEIYEAHLVRLGPSGSEMRADMEMPVFSTLQILFQGGSGKEVPVDGKVIEAEASAGTFIVRFSGGGDSLGEIISRILEGR